MDYSFHVFTVVETRHFIRAAASCLTDEQRQHLIEFIAQFPAAGAVIRGTGGVRKIRWAAKGSGKRGGSRIIYYFGGRAMPVFLLTVFRKSRKGDITTTEKRQVKQVVQRLVESYSV